MTVVSRAVVVPCTTVMKFGVSIFRRGFNSSKCKTMAKLSTARIKLLRNKREVVVKQMRRDVALLLQSGQDATARIRVEHVIREQNIMEANEIIELFCELVVVRLPVIAKQRECPADLKEGIASLIFAAPRCSDIPELLQIRNIFEKKYGKEFVSAATDLRPNCGVNRVLIEKLSVRTTTGEVKLKLMKEIAKEYQIEWDTTESEKELLKPPEELIEGPRTFVSATSMPMKPILSSQGVEQNMPTNRSTNDEERGGDIATMHFKNTAAAAQAAAESAKKAMAAAQAAAYLANKNSHQPVGFDHIMDDFNNPKSSNSAGALFMPNNLPMDSEWNRDDQPQPSGRLHATQSLNRPYSLHDERTPHPKDLNGRKFHRRHSHNVPFSHTGIKFDDSDGFDSEYDEEIEVETPSNGSCPPPNKPPPSPPSHSCQSGNSMGTDYAGLRVSDPAPHLHPKLPDYDAIAARFEALKFHR
ncbi:uncharacterized protein LOC122064686 [Macadamia integrifolia]|uniref:uncharacterized protein LOC122064686 n=1 Tax=Macadamia integrifolia TaxID=60698 RepID=UPI001C50057B|nr:uncharacterized protein LOC122064686 [Macadamia integrifolia]